MGPSAFTMQLRLAQTLLKRDPTMQLTTFLMADAVLAAKAQQKTQDGITTWSGC